MNYIQNKYNDYAQLIQSGNKINFYCGFDKLGTYDVRDKVIQYKYIQFDEENEEP